ncbi:hypothetical protein N1031_17125 [Herbiconiux moechotypicola]|uniref:Uncharacterized protein n=1 Tax=Herbiconiux moechotypicola TaxID=637393 RepID=A0ABN3DR33_9MICO|nr:hypothetical protein [Herbiconiux moechotypicola]MCS5731486.1 hypothetical protein [Herbiconiux moechotypicola]
MNHPENSTDLTPSGSGLRRRTLLQGAAWSVPVIAVAAAAPGAAASGGGRRIEGAFLIVGDFSETTDTIAGGLFIRNTTGSAITLPAGALGFSLSGLESTEYPYLETTFSGDAADGLDGVGSDQVANTLFSAGSVSSDGHLNVYSIVEITLDAGEEIVIGFYFRWRHVNEEPHVFAIAGIFVVDYGGLEGAEAQATPGGSVAVPASAG